MQTFMPYPSFKKSAQVLDTKRLGKQRVEVKQILNALDGKSKGWVNHPATRMWRGYETSLTSYGIIVCSEWRNRGFKDSLLEEFLDRHASYRSHGLHGNDPMWVYNSGLNLSHRSNLLRKDPLHYRKFWPDDPDDLPYVWPV